MLQKRALPQATDGQNVEPCGQFAGPSVCTELAACNTLGVHSKPRNRRYSGCLTSKECVA